MTPDRAATDRQAARERAVAATLAWVHVTLTQLGDLAARAGATGPDRAVMFEVGIDHTDEEHAHWREELRAVTFADLTTEVVLHHGEPDDTWATAVDLWIELREALAALNGTETPPGILVNLDAHAVGAWEAYYCPDLGPLPSLLQIIPDPAELASPVDPFLALLDDADGSDGSAEILAMERMLTLHDLTPPTLPGHAPGACDVALPSDD